MATSEKPAPAQYATREGCKRVARKGGVQRHYANDFFIDPNSTTDLMLTFGQYVPEGEGYVIESRVEVTMPMLIFKSLVQWGALFIADFERRNGEIKSPVMADPPSANASQIEESVAPETKQVIH
jgi:hypothetical protein